MMSHSKFKEMLRDKNSLKRGMLLQLILGPPLAKEAEKLDSIYKEMVKSFPQKRGKHGGDFR